MAGMTLDAGALIAFEKRQRHAHEIVVAARLERARLTVSAAVLAQVWRGNSPSIARLLAGCVVEPMDSALAKLIGVLLASSGTADIVDAAVVVGAHRRGDAIVTSDPDDIRRLLATLGSTCRVLPV